jgi:hypothetical protein
MKKLLLLLLLSLGLIGCSSTAPLQVEVGSKSYDWKKWDCFDIFDDNYLLSVGYIPDISDSRGVLFLKDAESPIDTTHTLEGVQHRWDWDDYSIIIHASGTGMFYDFSGAKSGETRTASEVYECTSKPLEKLMSDII